MMDKMMTLGIILSAKDAFSPVFGSLKGTVKNITKDMGTFSTAMTKIGTVSQGAFSLTRGFAETAIKSFVDLEDAQTQLKNTLMKSDGTVSPFFKSISDEATKLGNKLPGTTADFYAMASTMKALGVEEQSIVGGALKSAAYLGTVLKIPYEEAATATAKFKQAMGIADAELLPFIDDIQRLSHMGVQVGEMSFAFSKIGATMKGLGMSGLKAARDVEPLIGMLIKSGFSGETVGTNLGNIIKNAVQFKGSKDLDKMGIKLKFTDDKGGFKGTANMIKELEKLKAIKSDVARLDAVADIFGKGEAATMANVLINEGADGLERFSKNMRIQADINKRADAASKTLGNTWEAMTGTVTNMLAILGGSLKPEMVSLTNWFNNTAASVTDFADKHPKVAKFVGVVVFGFVGLTAVIGTLGIAIGALTFGINALGIKTAVVTVAQWAWNSSLIANTLSMGGMILKGVAMVAIFTGYSAFLATVTAAQWLWNIALNANPIGLIITGVAALVGLGVTLYNKWKPFADVWNSIFGTTGGASTPNVPSTNRTTNGSGSRIPARNQQVAQAKASVGGRYGSSSQSVNVTINNPNFTSKEHAAATQKQLDEQVRRAMQRHTNDKQDRSYGSGSRR